LGIFGIEWFYALAASLSLILAVITGFKETQLELSFKTDDLLRVCPGGRVTEAVALVRDSVCLCVFVFVF